MGRTELTYVMIYDWDNTALDVMEEITGDTKAEIIEDALALYMADRNIENETIRETDRRVNGE